MPACIHSLPWDGLVLQLTVISITYDVLLETLARNISNVCAVIYSENAFYKFILLACDNAAASHGILFVFVGVSTFLGSSLLNSCQWQVLGGPMTRDSSAGLGSIAAWSISLETLNHNMPFRFWTCLPRLRLSETWKDFVPAQHHNTCTDRVKPRAVPGVRLLRW